jgi:hypothetical protein
MKITPDLFTQVTPPPRQAREATQARLAFEAMLSAGAARQSVAARVDQPVAMRPASPVNTQTATKDDVDAPLARPGRVLDIRV